ncbi:hypothetical protein DPMN_100166 [Dreissena polymorpha]|uniref:Uncharacterized protein n=1 Tax=Dreissena polymorpha TaxID=45954 RepID=A0A9D4LGC9_DREPO|nr:hypothetical protein DPMN_100166 [Dreissena polymorpha]
MSFEKVFSDIRSAAKEMILRIQEPTDKRSLEEKTAIFQSSLRQAEKMFKHQDYHFRRLSERSCFLEALNASQEKKIQMYEEQMKECEMLKSQISTAYSSTLNETVEVLRRESAWTLGVRSEPSHQLELLIEKEALLEQEYDETQKDLNNHEMLLSGHEVNMTEKTIQMYRGVYEEPMKECEMLKSQISTAHSSELLTIAKSLEDMRKICVKNEETLVKEMDLLQQDIALREDEIKKLNLSLQSVKSNSNEDRNKWLRQIESQEEHMIIQKKKKKILQNRLITLNETVEVLRRESAWTLGVRSEPSHQLELLIEKEGQLEQEYDEIQKDLNNHEMLLSGHEVNMTDSPTTSGLSTLATDKLENDEPA